MNEVSRRSFLGASAAVPIAAWASRFVPVDAFAIVTRPELSTAPGQAMLKKYAAAVAIMKDTTKTPANSPLSWTFQWYTHWTPSNKTTLLNQLYPGGQPANYRAIALAAWATCQAHFQPAAREQFFLTWHRWYVAEFEAIIRAVLKDDAFALPYWDYTKSQVLPQQFRLPNDPAFKSLYNQRRGRGINNKPINDGDPIDTAAALKQMVHQALCERRYNPVSASAVDRGLCEDIDFNLHGTVHGDIGGDMGSVPTAANDPIFWMHHCNIDRLWASWVASGGKNPGDSGFLNEPFTYAGPDAKPVTRKSGDCLKTDVLGYKYDRLEPRPADCPLAAPEATTAPVTTLRATGPVTLGTAPTRVAMQPVASREGAAPGNHVALVLSGISAPASPETVYHVYVNVPDNASAAAREAQRVGQISFFDVVPTEGHEAAHDKTLVFDITGKVPPASASKVDVTIAPRGAVASGAAPTIRDVQIVRR